jgi:hypothetical protein
LDSWELADFVTIGCCASDASMSTRPSMIRDRIATERRLVLLAHRYDIFSGYWRHWELTGVAGDTKAGTLIAKDKFGNKYYENLEEELPCEHTEILLPEDVH